MSKKKGSKLSHISIKPSDNGVTVDHGMQSGAPMEPGQSGSNVFTSPSEASQHVSDLIHGHFSAMGAGQVGNDNDADDMPAHFQKAAPRFAKKRPTY